MPFLVQQDELFVWGGGRSESRDGKGTVDIHQEDLVVIEGRHLAELGQFVVPTGTQWHLGVAMELQGLIFLYLSSLFERFPLRVLVHMGFGGD